MGRLETRVVPTDTVWVMETVVVEEVLEDRDGVREGFVEEGFEDSDTLKEVVGEKEAACEKVPLGEVEVERVKEKRGVTEVVTQASWDGEGVGFIVTE